MSEETIDDSGNMAEGMRQAQAAATIARIQAQFPPYETEGRRRWALDAATRWATDLRPSATVEDVERWAQRAERFVLTGSFSEEVAR